MRDSIGGIMKRTICLLAFTIFSLGTHAAQSKKIETAPTIYRLGIFPYMAPRQIVELLGPLATKMQDELKHEVKLESATTFADFNLEIKRKNYDIALIQPFDYHDVVNKYGYLPLAQLDAQLFTQLIVRDDSRYQKLDDLKGTTIGLPPEQSANARMSLRTLYEKNIIPGRDIQIQYFKSHDSCLQQVWIGEISACGTSKSPMLVFEQRMQAKLRSVFDTPPIPQILFVAHPRVKTEGRKKLQQLLIGLSQTEEGRALLKTLGYPGFVIPKPAEYLIMQNYESGNQPPQSAKKTGNDFSFGVFPYLSPRKLSENLAPALHALSQSTGKNISFRSTTSFNSFREELVKQTNDIVFVQPFDYGLAVNNGYLPLARMNDYLQSKFFVLDSSPYQKIADFKGQVIAMPPSESAMSRLARHALIKNGLKLDSDVTIKYTINHEACAQMVKNTDAVACATNDQTIPMLPNELTHNLRAVGVFESIPGVLFMAHKRVSKKARLQLQETIISWKNSESGRNIIEAIHFGEYVKANAHEYLNMSKFE